MPIVNVHEAKTQLSRLLAQAEAGEEVVIARHGDPVVRLVPCKPKGKRRFGAMKGKIVVDDSILEPLAQVHLNVAAFAAVIGIVSALGSRCSAGSG